MYISVMNQRQRILTLFTTVVLIVLVLPFSENMNAQTNDLCFSETGHCISGRIREFWEQNGGLSVFGLPITPQRQETIEGKSLQVQWFERNRLELHPENERPYDVLLGRLSVDVLAQQGRNWEEFQPGQPQGVCQTFETGHHVCNAILERWQNPGSQLSGLELFGLPISSLQWETLSDGQEYLVQWFERARFELHPENDPPHDILLGLLGNEVMIDDSSDNPDLAVGLIAFERQYEGEDGRTDIYVMNADGSGIRQLTNGDYNRGPRWSPDNSKIVFHHIQEPEPGWNIATINANGSGFTRLTNDDATNTFPDWSPDGSKIAFQSNRGGNPDVWEIYVMNSDGTDITRITRNATKTQSSRWSPDGSKIAFDMLHDNAWNIYVMNVDGSDQVQLTDTEFSDVFPKWSPDGSKIAFHSNRNDNWDVYVMNADGSNVMRLTSHPAKDQFPDWSPDGTRIVFQSDRNGNFDLYTMNVDGSNVRQITNDPADDREPAWSRNP